MIKPENVDLLCVPKKAKEVVAYIRASTKEQKLTLEFQKSSLIKKANELGVVLKDKNIYVDGGISGYSTTYDQRPGLSAILERVMKGEVSMFLTFRRDRPSRRAREYMFLAFTFYTKGVQVAFSDPSEVPFCPHHGWLIECLMAGLLQREVESIRDKVSLGLLTAHRNGQWTGELTPKNWTNLCSVLYPILVCSSIK